eukprot:1738418-Alexandrium_andersonii.AAC.1
MVWNDPTLSRKLKLRVYDACIKARLLYALGVCWPHSSHLKRLEACHVGCLRKILKIPTTYGARKMQVPPVRNVDALKKAGQDSITASV